MRRTILIAAMAGLCATSGCKNPLKTYDDERGARLRLSQRREIQPFNMSQYAVPEAQQRRDAELIAGSRFEGLESFEMSLPEARASALHNNLDLQVALLDPTIAAQSVSEEEAAFESVITGSALWNETDSPTASTLVGSEGRFQQIIPGVRVPLRTGGTAEINLPMSRNRTNNQFATLNPAYTADLEFSLSHQLLRGAGRRANTHAIRIASLNQQISETQTKLETIRQIAAADRAYWRLYAFRAVLEARQTELEFAQAQLEQAERQVRAGRSPEIEVIRAQAGVAERLDAIITAQTDVLRAQRDLKRIINLPGLDVGTDTLIVTATDPDPVELAFDDDELTKAAVLNRMEMLEFELRLAQDLSQIEFDRNQTLPLLALDYTYRINGLGESLGDAFEQVSDNDFEDWQLGLSAEIPIGNEAAKSRLRRALLSRLSRLRSKSARELAIRQEVLDAIDSLEAAWQKILASRQSVILNMRAYEAEQRQFEVGRSTSTNVLDQLTRLATARVDEIRALTEYQIAQVDLAFATGTLLGAARVRWEPGDPLEGEDPSATYEPVASQSAPPTNPG